MRPRTPLSLEKAIDQFFEVRGFKCVITRRNRKNHLSALFQSPVVTNAFWTVETTASDTIQSAAELDDALYDGIVKAFEEWSKHKVQCTKENP